MVKLNVQKRQHRERGQPLNRQRYGLLEKHKDYVERARDYHSKQDRLKTLRTKAEARNKDEFYFGMVRSKTNKGVHVASRGNEALPVEVVKLLKTQDVKYVQAQRASEKKRIERLREQIGSLVDENGASSSTTAGLVKAGPAPSKRAKHTLFTDKLETLQAKDPLKLLSKSKASSKGKAKADADVADGKDEATTHRERLVAELNARVERENTLARAERELELQRLLMGKGSKSIIGKRKRGREEGTAGDEGSDEEFRGEGPKKAKLPKAEEGVATKARVWKWRAERRR